MRSLEERKAMVASLPWVTYLKRGQQCTGWMRRGASKPCKNAAHWKFRAKKERGKMALMGADFGVYCWNHIFSRGLFYSMGEEERTLTYMKKHHPDWCHEVECCWSDGTTWTQTVVDL